MYGKYNCDDNQRQRYRHRVDIVMMDLALVSISLMRRNKACHLRAFLSFHLPIISVILDVYADVAVSHIFLCRNCIWHIFAYPWRRTTVTVQKESFVNISASE